MLLAIRTPERSALSTIVSKAARMNNQLGVWIAPSSEALRSHFVCVETLDETGARIMSTLFRHVVFAAVLALVAGISDPARAGVVYSNFGPGQSYNSNSEWQVYSDDAYAMQFAPTTSFTFTDAVIPMISLQGPNVYDVTLSSDSGGMPGSVLETIALNGVVSTTAPALVTATSVLEPTLSAGSLYWLIVWTPSFNTIGGLSMNSIGDLPNNNFAYSNFNYPTGGWHIFNQPIARPAFEIDGVPRSVPEPSSLILAAAAASIGVICGRFRRRLSA